MGFSFGWLYECIVTTYHEDGTPNAAPIGVTKEKDLSVTIRVHTTTDTYRNIERGGVFCINVVTHPLLFLKAAVLGHGRGSAEEELDDVEFGGCKKIDAPSLWGGDACYEIAVTEKTVFDRKDALGVTPFAQFRGKMVDEVVFNDRPRPYNRGLGAAVELAIELSRGKKDGIDRYLMTMKKVMPEDEFKMIKDFLDNI